VILDAHIPQVFYRAFQIVRIFAGLANTPRNYLHLIFKGQLARILFVRPVHDETQGFHLFARAINQCERADHIEINTRHLFTLFKIGTRLLRICRIHLEGLTTAGATTIKTKNQPRAVRRAPMNMAIDTKCPVIPVQARGKFRFKGETWPPHQRAIPKYP